MRRSPNGPRAGSFYGRLLGAMEEGRHNPARGEEASEETGIGRLLEHKRKEQGLSLEEVEQATKIRKRYLTGLEHDDYAVLPDAVYARGFLKTYANYLGLDGEAFARELKSTRKPRREQRGIDYNSRPETDFEQPLMSAGGLSGTRKRKISTSAIVTLLVALLVLAAVIGTLYFVGRGVQASREDTPATPPRQEQQNVADRERATENGKAKEDGGRVQGKADAGVKAAGAEQN